MAKHKPEYSPDPEWEAECYRALQVEGWDTEELLAAEADPVYVELAKVHAERTGAPWPPPAVGRDFIGQIIAYSFGLED